MRAKYGLWTVTGDIRMSRISFFIQWEICAHALMALASIRWSIDNGKLMCVLRDAWLSNLPLMQWLTMVSIKDSDMRIYDLFVSGKRIWDTALIHRVFDARLMYKIISQLIPTLTLQIDRSIWQFGCSLKVKAMDFYELRKGRPNVQIDRAWIFFIREWHFYLFIYL